VCMHCACHIGSLYMCVVAAASPSFSSANSQGTGRTAWGGASSRPHTRTERRKAEAGAEGAIAEATERTGGARTVMSVTLCDISHSEHLCIVFQISYPRQQIF